MDDSLFARMGYDPVRIFARIHGHKPTGIARLGPASSPEAESAPPEPEPVEPPPLELKAEAEENPPPARLGETAEAPAVDEESPRPDASPPEPEGKAGSREAADAEAIRLMRAWLDEHWDDVQAMARAGEAPQRPAPPEPEAARPVEPIDPPCVAPGDRWTKWKMAEFLRQLAATHSVTA